MKISYLKNLLFVALYFTLFSTYASETIYVGKLSLGKKSSITDLVELAYEDDSIASSKLPSQNELIEALNQGPSEKSIDKHKTLRVSPTKPYNLLLVNSLLADNPITKIAHDISQSFYQFEHSNWFVYVKNNGDESNLKAYNISTKQNINIATMPPRFSTFKITKTGHVVTTDGKKLFHTQLILRGEFIQANNKWQLIKTPANTISGNITELSISHFGNKIAIKSAI